MLAKETFRKETLKRLKDIEREAFYLEGLKAATLLHDSYLWPECQVLFIFLSMNTEIDTKPIIKTALRDGKKVFAPKVDSKFESNLAFYPVFSPDGPWTRGAFGILEPESHECTEAVPAFTTSQKIQVHTSGIDNFPVLILTPGLAFDREGNRLGRGKGYYDRFFAKLDKEGREYTAIGFCMDFQLAEKVPASEHDKKMHGVLTGTELLIF